MCLKCLKIENIIIFLLILFIIFNLNKKGKYNFSIAFLLYGIFLITLEEDHLNLSKMTNFYDQDMIIILSFIFICILLLMTFFNKNSYKESFEMSPAWGIQDQISEEELNNDMLTDPNTGYNHRNSIFSQKCCSKMWNNADKNVITPFLSSDEYGRNQYQNSGCRCTTNFERKLRTQR